jgi:hypothetical protein
MGDNHPFTELQSLPLSDDLVFKDFDNVVVDAAWYELVETSDYAEFLDTLNRLKTEEKPEGDAPFYDKSAIGDYDDIVKTADVVA